MAQKALRLADKLVSSIAHKGTKVLDSSYISPQNASVFGFLSTQKSLESANSFFTAMNNEEKALIDEREILLKEVIKGDIPWDYFEANISDQQVFQSIKKYYEDLVEKTEKTLDKGALVLSKEAEAADAAEIDVTKSKPELSSQIQERIAKFEDQIENDFNPLLNPFADFWTYEMDGPEFAEVFSSRPQWNEMINTASDEYAFDFPKVDPVLSTELQAQYNDQISQVFAEFKPETEGLELIEQIAQGKLFEQLQHTFNIQYLAPQEKRALEFYTHEDNSNLALRTAWVSQEVDPVGKHFGGH